MLLYNINAILWFHVFKPYATFSFFASARSTYTHVFTFCWKILLGCRHWYYSTTYGPRTRSFFYISAVQLWHRDNSLQYYSLICRLYFKIFIFSLKIFFLPFFRATPTHAMWKFPSQGLNMHQGRDQSHCSDNSGSLTHCTREPLNWSALGMDLISILKAW